MNHTIERPPLKFPPCQACQGGKRRGVFRPETTRGLSSLLTKQTILTFICTLILLAGLNSAALAKRFHFEGEYSLWVSEQNGEVTVRWLTASKDSGLMEVSREGAEIARFKTPVSNHHRVQFDITDREPFSLHYGSLHADFDRHDTFIDLEPERPQAILKEVDSLFVIGDIHGEFDHVVGLLKSTNLIDAQLRWIGGKRHVMALGDIFDRGQDVIRTLWFLYRLEREASASGGALHVILGNHEIMAMGNDIRYLAGKERAIADLYGVPYSEMFDPQTSILGRWLASRLAVMRIGKILLTHGGLSSRYVRPSIEAINDSLYTFIHEPVFEHLLQDSLALTMTDSLSYYRRLQFFHGKESTFWYRGYVEADTLHKELTDVLKSKKASLLVIAHTPFNTITELYGGKIIDVDLIKPASEMLLLMRKKKNEFEAKKVDLEGRWSPVLPPSPGDIMLLEEYRERDD